MVRNPALHFNHLVRLLPKDYVYLVSATPALNHVKDYYGVYLILWENVEIRFDLLSDDLTKAYASKTFDLDDPSFRGELLLTVFANEELEE